jgi:hypothetical protein
LCSCLRSCLRLCSCLRSCLRLCSCSPSLCKAHHAQTVSLLEARAGKPSCPMADTARQSGPNSAVRQYTCFKRAYVADVDSSGLACGVVHEHHTPTAAHTPLPRVHCDELIILFCSIRLD